MIQGIDNQEQIERLTLENAALIKHARNWESEVERINRNYAALLEVSAGRREALESAHQSIVQASTDVDRVKYELANKTELAEALKRENRSLSSQVGKLHSELASRDRSIKALKRRKPSADRKCKRASSKAAPPSPVGALASHLL